MSIQIIEATHEHIPSIQALYFLVYGLNYPLAFAQDTKLMEDMLNSSTVNWLLAEESEDGSIVGSVIFRCDHFWRIGKLEGVVVHPMLRGKNIATEMIAMGLEKVLKKEDNVDSIFTTTRTISLGPQKMCLKNGFYPLGIFPNSRKLEDFESLTLMAAFRENTLSKRKSLPIPKELHSLMQIVNRTVNQTSELISTPDYSPIAGNIYDFEIIKAPRYVTNKFYKTFSSDSYAVLYPFHQPNTLITCPEKEIDFYAYISTMDQYCTIITCTQSLYTLGKNLEDVMRKLHAHNVSYIEFILDLEYYESIKTLLEIQFLPCAIYPAFYKQNGEYRDVVIMARCLEPLNFKGMKIDKKFKPYVETYVEQWQKSYLNSFDVASDSIPPTKIIL